jgi:uncharacterized membrane protein YkvA (DUF1232 family)
MTNDSYRHHFSESGFFSKIRQLTGTLLEYAFLLYLVMSKKDTPHGIRLVIIAALGYLICPFDAIPDFLPFGFTDDLAVLAALVASLDGYITAEMRQRAREKLS